VRELELRKEAQQEREREATRGIFAVALGLAMWLVVGLDIHSVRNSRPQPAEVVRLEWKNSYADWAPGCTKVDAHLSNITDRCETLASAERVLPLGAPCISDLPSICYPLYLRWSRVSIGLGRCWSIPYQPWRRCVELSPVDSGDLCVGLSASATNLCLAAFRNATEQSGRARITYQGQQGPTFTEPTISGVLLFVTILYWSPLYCLVPMALRLCCARCCRRTAPCCEGKQRGASFQSIAPDEEEEAGPSLPSRPVQASFLEFAVIASAFPGDSLPTPPEAVDVEVRENGNSAVLHVRGSTAQESTHALHPPDALGARLWDPAAANSSSSPCSSYAIHRSAHDGALDSLSHLKPASPSERFYPVLPFADPALVDA